MFTNNHRGLMVIASGAVLVLAMHACTSVSPGPGGLIVPGLPGPSVVQTQRRVAEGGDSVTVDYGVVPGPLPDSNMSAGSPEITVAVFSNRGEGGKKEKRYKWRPRTQAKYSLALSPGRSGRTNWTMYEHTTSWWGRSSKRAHRGGSLRRCDPPPPHRNWTVRLVEFKDCPIRGIPYDPIETADITPNTLIRFASYVSEGDEARLSAANGASAPAWISCNSGCCSLGAY